MDLFSFKLFLMGWVALDLASAFFMFLRFWIEFRPQEVKIVFRPLVPMLVYSYPLIFGGVLGWINNSGDRYFITHFLGLEAVAIYSAAYILCSLISICFQPINFVLYPYLTTLWNSGEREKAKNYVETVLNIYFVFSPPILIGLIFFGPNLLQIFIGEVSDSYNIVYTISLVSLGFFFFGTQAIFNFILQLGQRTKLLTSIYFVCASVNMALNYLLVPSFGMNGAAFATLISYFTSFSWAMILAFRIIPIKIAFYNFFVTVVSSLVVVGVLRFHIFVDGMLVIFLGIGALLLYFLLQAVLGGYSIRNYQNLVSLLRRA
jgi:O-antigen/teichoic acid export membrane protein